MNELSVKAVEQPNGSWWIVIGPFEGEYGASEVAVAINKIPGYAITEVTVEYCPPAEKAVV